jgi:hypothetical protein
MVGPEERVSVRVWRQLTGALDSVGARIRLFLAIASFGIYASSVLALHQHRDVPFHAEREAYAAAVSTIVFGAPFGTLYSGVSARIRDPNTPLETALKQTTEGDVAPGVVLQGVGVEGNGIGYFVLVTGAMLIFGINTASPTLAMLALMAISGATLLYRFGADHSILVLLYFVALTLLLFTPAVWEPLVASEVPIGGIRYFCVVGLLPAFYLALELFDATGPRPAIGWWRFCLLAVPVLILVLAVLTRTSNAALLGVIGLIGFCSLWRHRRDRSGRRRQLGNGALIAGVAGGFFAAIVLSLPLNYLSEGRFTGIVWHRAFISLGLNPEWPFGNLREVYDCGYSDTSPGLRLEPGLADSNGECVGLHYAHAHQLSAMSVALYETAEREAFFNVAHLYQRQVLDTHIYYKSRMLLAEIMNAIVPDFRLYKYSPLLRGLFVAACGVVLAFLVIPTTKPDLSLRGLRLLGMVFIFGISAFPGYYFAWPGTSQTFDLKLYTLLLVGAVLNTFAEWVKCIPTAQGNRDGRTR